MRILISCFIFICSLPGHFETNNVASNDFHIFSIQFVDGIKKLEIPRLHLSYLENLQEIHSHEEVKKQISFFNKIIANLKRFDAEKLSDVDRIDYDIITYETRLNIERLNLEQQWNAEGIYNIPLTGLSTLYQGKQWYQYYLKRWVAADVSPEYIFKLGLGEVKRVNYEINRIRKGLNLDSVSFYHKLSDEAFFLRDPSSVQLAYEKVKDTGLKNLNKVSMYKMYPV